MSIPEYKSQVHDNQLDMQHRTYMLARSARNLWDWWMDKSYEEQADPKNEEVLRLFRDLYQELKLTDVFMHGYQQGKREVK